MAPWDSCPTKKVLGVANHSGKPTVRILYSTIMCKASNFYKSFRNLTKTIVCQIIRIVQIHPNSSPRCKTANVRLTKYSITSINNAYCAIMRILLPYQDVSSETRNDLPFAFCSDILPHNQNKCQDIFHS
jgi:hypothetical protein